MDYGLRELGKVGRNPICFRVNMWPVIHINLRKFYKKSRHLHIFISMICVFFYLVFRRKISDLFHSITLSNCISKCNLDSLYFLGAWLAQSVQCLTTGWTTGISGFDPRQGKRIFPLSSVSRPALGPTQPPVQWVPGVLSLGLKRGSVMLTTHPHLVPRSWMSRSYTSSPRNASMACSGTALLFYLLTFFGNVTYEKKHARNVGKNTSKGCKKGDYQN
jgi:hypothetical protein